MVVADELAAETVMIELRLSPIGAVGHSSRPNVVGASADQTAVAPNSGAQNERELFDLTAEFAAAQLCKGGKKRRAQRRG
ncbi:MULTISPECIES: hypothetical protein [Bradyrhizobium]|uniref:Transposase n=1 Tax=Bradyrhizobium denitrificans TaxID=2734912 RepID=A0ABS5GA66_9BRAD|nr:MULTISPECIES: hypothetical protein [Bradyrhizobium]MBR1138222.1 hypothetical protein [Bradyrhizobium denitrificans]MCL8489147.1 hypothetical protein [Bradyrhizobium denitrificans]MDU0955428.1 hypothetical protein [Bradyrhizobium sp.]MDU1496408.1 hypothetical protein [Bradyrhizobium sp.]MDU1546558.1 hypothetical protein [Bradyrhizobium sp.]